MWFKVVYTAALLPPVMTEDQNDQQSNGAVGISVLNDIILDGKAEGQADVEDMIHNRPEL